MAEFVAIHLMHKLPFSNTGTQFVIQNKHLLLFEYFDNDRKLLHEKDESFNEFSKCDLVGSGE